MRVRDVEERMREIMQCVCRLPSHYLWGVSHNANKADYVVVEWFLHNTGGEQSCYQSLDLLISSHPVENLSPWHFLVQVAAPHQ